MDVSGANPALIVFDAIEPSISPDGKKIVFSIVGDNTYNRIAVADLSDPHQRRILTSEEDGLWNHSDPQWSLDGEWISYSSRHNLWIVPAKGGKPDLFRFKKRRKSFHLEDYS